MSRKLSLFFFTTIYVVSLVAAVPRQIAYQGILTDSNGNPLPDGDTTVTFTLYDTSGNGVGWTEDQTVTVSQGLFSALLGAVNPLDVAFDEPYELGVRVEGSVSELSPRVRLGSAAYALRAAVADSVVSVGERVSTEFLITDQVNAASQVNVGLDEGPQALNVIGSIAMTGSIREFSDTAASAVFAGTGNTTGPGLELYARNHPSLPGKAYLAYGGYDSLGHFQIRRYNGTSFANVALFDSVGRFGIGTTAPKTNVHIRSGDDPTLKIQSDGTDEVSGRISFRQSNETGVDMYYDGTATEALIFETFASDGASRGRHFALDQRGNFGIGTDAISDWGGGYKGVNIGGAEFMMHSGGGGLFLGTNAYYSSDGWHYEIGGGASLLQLGRGIMSFRTAPSGSAGDPLTWNYRLHVNETGIGIGTQSPGEKLEVAGNVKATNFIVGAQTLTVPDYVFAEDYSLMPLEEVLAYVQQHKHLPGIPSEAKVREKGLDLTEMNLAHLEKIEELTLYAIRAKQERDVIAGENAAMRAEIAEMKKTLLRLETKLNTEYSN